MTSDELQTIREIAQRIDYLEKEIAKQAIEYARRLEELNHERDREREAQSKFVTQDSFSPYHDDVNKQLRTLNTFMDRIMGRVAMYPVLAFVASSLITVAAVILGHLWH